MAKSITAEEPSYFPLEKGIYEVAPGLRPLGADIGAGDLDKKIFQITREFDRFRENKFSCYNENICKYRPQLLANGKFKNHLKKFFIERFSEEYPDYISVQDNHVKFKHTGDELTPTNIKVNSTHTLPLNHMDDLDLISLQFPEDWAITELMSDGKDELSYLNVCAPSHWAPAQKLHQSFLQVHQTIPGSEKLVNSSRALVEAMIQKGPYVRFVWSFVTDKTLNHHPEPPPGADPVTWKGRSWNADQTPPFHLRIERQTTWGFPEFNRALFTIRVSFMDGTDLLNSPEKRKKLKTSLESMTPASRIYKGVDKCFPELIESLS